MAEVNVEGLLFNIEMIGLPIKGVLYPAIADPADFLVKKVVALLAAHPIDSFIFKGSMCPCLVFILLFQ